jgi:hypothetical protein
MPAVNGKTFNVTDNWLLQMTKWKVLSIRVHFTVALKIKHYD